MNDGIFDINQAHKLDNLGRIKELKPFELLQNVAGVTKSMVCIDFGSGTGTFALPLAVLVDSQIVEISLVFVEKNGETSIIPRIFPRIPRK